MRTVWHITGVVVLVAAVIVGVRSCYERRRAERILREAVIEPMFALVEEDPQVRRPATRSAVEAVAALAERGVLESAETYFALGLRYYGQGALAEAEAAYRRAIALAPAWSWPYNGLGVALHRLDRTDEAERNFRKAIELDPDWARAHNSLFILLRLEGRLEEAEEEALKALELAPHDVAAHNNYGNLLLMQEKFDEAERAYRRAVELDPTHPTPHYNLACLFSLTGREDKAVAFLNKAVAQDEAFLDEALRDPDLEPLHDQPEFKQLVEGAV